jgi:hypothetical protein
MSLFWRRKALCGQGPADKHRLAKLTKCPNCLQGSSSASAAAAAASAAQRAASAAAAAASAVGTGVTYCQIYVGYIQGVMTAYQKSCDERLLKRCVSFQCRYVLYSPATQAL